MVNTGAQVTSGIRHRTRTKKNNKKTQYRITKKMNNTDPVKKQRLTHVFEKCKEFPFPVRHNPCYSL